MARRALLVGNIIALPDGLNWPQLRSTRVIEGILPGCLEFLRNWPTFFCCVIAQPETEQMASMIW